MFESKKKTTNKTNLFVQRIIGTAVAGLDGRLLTLFSLWFGFLVAYRLVRETQTLNFNLISQDLFYLWWTPVFCL